jgi:hypothetical protein
VGVCGDRERRGRSPVRVHERGVIGRHGSLAPSSVGGEGTPRD